MKKLFIILGAGILILVVVGVLALGYVGLMPGVSAIFGANQPRDLGVEPTAADLVSAQEKLGQVITDPQVDPAAQLKTATGNPVDTILTQEEYTAHAEQIHPVSDLQIKLEGSSFEISGRLDKARIPQFARTWGLTDASDREILDVVDKYAPVDPIFYIAGTGGAENNQLEIDLTRAELGRLSVSTEQAREALESYTEALFQQVPGFSVDNSYIENGQLIFQGTVVEEVPRY